MLITKSGSYIVRGNTPMGESYHHVYLTVGYDTARHPQMGEVVAGPCETGEEAWKAFRTGIYPAHPMYMAK